jgi:ABC-type transport system involved in multi-copper enzyme maturation permease subunit
MIAARIPWRSPWARLMPLILLVMAPAVGQWLGWMVAPETLEPVSLLSGPVSWAVTLSVLAVLVKWSGLLTNPRLRMETGAQIPGAALAFLAAGVKAMLANWVFENLSVFAVLAHALACLWLCANAFGSEFEHRTLGQSLLQPRSRGDVYREKLGVAGGIAGVAAAIFFLTTSQSITSEPLFLAMTLGPMILGLASAPFFTLISRSTLAGFVFTLAAPMGLYLILQTLLDVYHARVHPDLLDRSREEKALLWAGGVIYLGATALAGWRVFKRLEWREGGAGGGSAAGLHALTGAWDQWIGRRWLGQAATAQLIRKELRLHVVPWLIASIMVGLWLLSLLVRKWAPESELGVAAANPSWVTLYAGILGIFIVLITGACAIAEERALGTLEWQWTQPIPMARQWRIKIGVATGLTLTLALMLPATLVWLGFDAETLGTTFGKPEWLPITTVAIAVTALFATSLYASSVSQSSMKAVALTPMLLGSLWAVGALTVWAVVATMISITHHEYVLPDLDHVTDPEILNRTPPQWLPPLGTLQQLFTIGAMILAASWLGCVVRSTQFNTHRLRMEWPTVLRQWGRLGGKLMAGLLLVGLLYVGLSQKRAEFDYLSSFRMHREHYIEFATQAEQEGKFTPEYLSPLGITNRPSPEVLVDALIRQRGFQWLLQDFVKHFHRKTVVGAHPRFHIEPALARRYGLQTRPTSPVFPTPSTNAASPESASPAPQPMMMSRELMMRYGLVPQRQPGTPSPTPSTNRASPESATPTPAPMPMMSQELMKRYGLLPPRPSRAPASTPPKASTNPPANPAPGQ